MIGWLVRKSIHHQRTWYYVRPTSTLFLQFPSLDCTTGREQSLQSTCDGANSVTATCRNIGMSSFLSPHSDLPGIFGHPP